MATESLNDLTVFVITIGDRDNFEPCIAHLKKQVVSFHAETIDHIAPMSAAFQQMIDRCKTPYYVQVDEDMMLFPNAIATLHKLITHDSSNGLAMVSAPLWDCNLKMPLQGVKIYRHNVFRRFPYENTFSCELTQLLRIKAAGYRIMRLPLDRNACLGEHGKHYTPETIFRRWQRLFQKHRKYHHLHWIEPWPQRLLERLLKSNDPLNLAAFLGAVAGMTGELPPDAELDYRVASQDFKRLCKFLVELSSRENVRYRDTDQ